MIDDFNTESLRCSVHEFYSEKKYPAIDILLSVMKGKEIFNGEFTMLWSSLI